MKKYFILLLAMVLCQATNAQDKTAAINTAWPVYAVDTSLTYQQITVICDSLFAEAGFTDTMRWQEDSADAVGVEEGSGYVKYLRWKAFWQHRYDVGTGKLHDICQDIIDALYNQNKTTSITNCAGTSSLQSSLTSGPVGWQFIGPRNITPHSSTGSGYGNSLHQFLGQVNEIIVNPANRSHVYIRDQWGGIWKTENAHAAPANTWTCLTDNLPAIAGLGVTHFYVDFPSSGPNRIFCVVGSPFQSSLPNINSGKPRTAGIFYSTNDGVTFNQMDVSTFISDFSESPILSMEYWPGNSSSATKYMFLTTPFRIYRVDITNPASVSHTPMYDIYDRIPANARAKRFKGFANMAFDKDVPSKMYVNTLSNSGDVFGNTAAIYQILHCDTCTVTCALQYVPAPANDKLGGMGTFDTVEFPKKYGGWQTNGWQRVPVTNPFLRAAPDDDTAKSVEINVFGSYLHDIDYNITFKLTLPPHTEVDLILKDVDESNIWGNDWGLSVSGPPNTTALCGYYYVGPGLIAGSGTLTPGRYINNTGTTVHTVITTTIHVPHDTGYVSRLEFGCYSLPSYIGGNVELDSVVITQEFDDYFKTFRTSPTTANQLFCIAETAGKSKLRKITDLGGGTFSLTEYNTQPSAWTIDKPDLFTFSSVNSNIIYFHRSQTSWYPRLAKLDLSSPTVYVNDSFTGAEIHPDARCLVALPNSAGTGDTLYVGTDGGIAKGTFTGHWTNLNGIGLRTSWANDIGSNIYTGQVGISATDNGVFWSNGINHSSWFNKTRGDGGQLKYGRSSISKSARFEGFTPGGPGYETLRVVENNPPPYLNELIHVTGGVIGLSKMANTFHGDFFGSRTGNCNVYKLNVVSGTGTSGDRYNFTFDSVTQSPEYSRREPVQAIGADMNDPDYMVIYMHTAPWERGYFAYTTNLTAVSPTWTFKENTSSSSLGGVDLGLTTLVVDPKNYSSGKRLWAGASGYNWGELRRVFQTVDGGGTWQNMSVGLPKGPVNALVYDDASGYLFAGTDQGVYAFNVNSGPNNSGNPWVCYSLHLPNMFVTGLDINRCTGKIYASSYGRGAYEAELPPPYVHFDTISSSTSYAITERRVNRSIYIPAGVTLTISNCTLYMGKDIKIVVAPAGKLIVENATLTSGCGYMWGGIEAWGNFAAPLTPAYQGQVSIRTGSVIEHALVGVRNHSTNVSYPKSRGIIQAYNCTFRNNVTDVHFTFEFPSWSLGADPSTFNKCRFLLDDDYKGGTFNLEPKKRVIVDMVNGVRFLGCSFANRNTHYRGRGDGIYANDAGFIVAGSSPCMVVPCASSSIPCKFSGFVNGILIKRTDPSYTPAAISVDQAQFDTVSIGVNISKHDAVSVIRSTFNVGRGYVNPSVAAPNIPLSCGKNIGILVQNAPLYRIEDNTLTGVSNSYGVTPWYNMGVLVANTGNKSNNIMLNRFSTLDYGVLGLGNNCTPYFGSMASGYGAQVSCNTFNSNVNDIYSGGTLASEGLGWNQRGSGSSGVPMDAANTFFGSTRNIVNANPNRPLNYYFHVPPSASTSGLVTFLYTGITNPCTRTVRTTGDGTVPRSDFMIPPTTALDLADLNTYKSDFYAARDNYNSKKDDLSGLIDRGNSDWLLNFIDTITNRNELYDTLTAISPWLSVYALATAVTNAQQGEYQNIIDLLVLNPDVIRNPDILTTFSDYMNMDTNDFNMLWDTVTNITVRTDLENEVGVYQGLMDHNASMVLWALRSPTDTTVSVYDTLYTGVCTDSNSLYYLVDTNTFYWPLDSIDVWLQNIGGLPAVYERIGLKLSHDDYEGAEDLYAAIDTTDFTQEELEEYHTYGVLYSVLIPAHQDGRNAFTLNEQELDVLDAELLRTDASGGFDGWDKLTYNSAKKLIWSIKIVKVTLPCPSDFVGMGGKPAPDKTKIWRYAINKVDVPGRSFVKAFPNPSKGMVTFEYSMPENINGTENATLSVTNVLGEKVMEQKIDKRNGRIQWNSGNLASGTYMYQLITNSGVVGVGKLVLIK